MDEVFQAPFVSLHVRVTNKAAIHLYKNILRYDVHDVEEKYYADGENAYDMRKHFRKKKERGGAGGGGEKRPAPG